jgi:hypothetical protein
MVQVFFNYIIWGWVQKLSILFTHVIDVRVNLIFKNPSTCQIWIHK